MKKIFLLLSIITCSLTIFAQCDKKLVFTSSKTEYLDSNFAVRETKEESIMIEITKDQIVITPVGMEEHKLSGPIKSISCSWTVPYKEGKTIIKAVLSNESGDVKNATITIEGKNGKVTLLGEVEERPDQKIRAMADKFEERS